MIGTDNGGVVEINNTFLLNNNLLSIALAGLVTGIIGTGIGEIGRASCRERVLRLV